jgi:plasmid stabilization system protein ParE
MNYRVVLQDGAIRAIEKHARYIAEEKESPLNAERWLTKVLRAVDTLQQFPHRCPPAPEDDYRDYMIRMLVVQNCLLLYTVDEPLKVVHVIGFRHGRQKPLADELPNDRPTST